MAKIRFVDMLSALEKATDVQLSVLAAEIAAENRSRAQQRAMSPRAERNQPPLNIGVPRRRGPRSGSRGQSSESTGQAPAPQ